MSPATHLLVSWTLADALAGSRRRDRLLVAWAGVIPDLDGLGIVVEMATANRVEPMLWYHDYHHVLAHNLPFAVLIALGVLAWTRGSVRTTLLAFAAVHLHLLCDILGSRGPDGYQYPIPYFEPFSEAFQLTWSGQWPLNSWPNFLITGLLLAWAARQALVQGRTPVEMVSLQADRVVVLALKTRFQGLKGSPVNKG